MKYLFTNSCEFPEENYASSFSIKYNNKHRNFSYIKAITKIELILE